MGRTKKVIFFLLAVTVCFFPLSVSARCGGVDYSWGAASLATTHDYACTMMIYVFFIIASFLAVGSVIASFRIFTKMVYGGDGDISKSIVMVVGSILFFIAASQVMPSFFGYSI